MREGDKPLNQRAKGTANEIKEGVERAAVSQLPCSQQRQSIGNGRRAEEIIEIGHLCLKSIEQNRYNPNADP